MGKPGKGVARAPVLSSYPSLIADKPLGGFKAADVGGRHRVHYFWGPSALLLFLLTPVPGIVAIITCAGHARGTHLVSRHTAITPGIAQAGDCIPAKGLGKSMNSVYALIYIVAAAAVVTGVFLVITSLTP